MVYGNLLTSFAEAATKAAEKASSAATKVANSPAYAPLSFAPKPPKPGPGYVWDEGLQQWVLEADMLAAERANTMSGLEEIEVATNQGASGGFEMLDPTFGSRSAGTLRGEGLESGAIRGDYSSVAEGVQDPEALALLAAPLAAPGVANVAGVGAKALAGFAAPRVTQEVLGLDELPGEEIGDLARDNLPGVAGEAVARAAEFTLDPLTLGGAGIKGTRVLPELLGKGSLTNAQYFASSALGGAGSAVGEEVGDELGGKTGAAIGSVAGGLVGGVAGIAAPKVGGAVVDAGLDAAFKPGLDPNYRWQPGDPPEFAPMGAVGGGAPDLDVETLARQLSETEDPQALITAIRNLDMSKKLELSMFVGKSNPQALREFGAQLARAEAGDMQAAQSIRGQFFRDNTVTRNRAAAMSGAMDALTAARKTVTELAQSAIPDGGSGSMFAGIPISRNNLQQQVRAAAATLTEPIPAPYGRQMSLPGFEPPEPVAAAVGGAMAQAAGPRKTVINRVIENILDIPSAAKGLTASGDILGYAQRQGLPALPNYPKAWTASVGDAWRAYWDDDAARAIALDMEKVPFFGTDTSVLVGNKVVSVPSFAEGLGLRSDFEVPGFEGLDDTLIASLVRQFPGFDNSERAMRTGMTSLGARIYAENAQDMIDRGVTDPGQYKQMLDHVKHLIGYGDVPTSLKGFSDGFYSLRNLFARLQTFTDPITMSGRARQVAFRDMVRFVSSEMALMGVARAIGRSSGMWSVEMDPRDSDFGKLRIGDTRIDLTGGFGTMYRLVARTGDAIGNPDSEYTQADINKEFLNFFRNKTAPIPSLAISYFTDQDPSDPRKPFTFDETTLQKFLPFALQDVAEAMSAGEFDKAAMLGGMGWIGLGSQNYPAGATELKQKAFEDVSREIGSVSDPELQRILTDPTTGRPVVDYKNLDSWQRDELARRFPEFAAKVEGASKDSEWFKTGQAKLDETAGAVGQFQRTGNADRFKVTLTNINDKYAEAYARLDAQANFRDTGSDWQKKVSGFWDDYGALVDPEDRDHAMENFRDALNPSELERFDSMLGSADDPTVLQYKQARQYLQANYWEPGDAFWEQLVANAPATSPLKKYPTYGDLINAISEHDEVARQLRNTLGGMVTDTKQAIRYKDPTIDGMLYVWGYSDGVYSKGGLDYAMQWATENRVNLARPPVLGLP